MAFLHARLDEDQTEIDKHPDDPTEPAGYETTTETGYPCLPVLIIGKKRALREVEAKRRIVKRHTGEHHCHQEEHEWYEAGERVTGLWPCDDLRDLAAAHVDHPDCKPEWKP